MKNSRTVESRAIHVPVDRLRRLGTAGKKNQAKPNEIGQHQPDYAKIEWSDISVNSLRESGGTTPLNRFDDSKNDTKLAVVNIQNISVLICRCPIDRIQVTSG